jgi:hypothetical protein
MMTSGLREWGERRSMNSHVIKGKRCVLVAIGLLGNINNVKFTDVMICRICNFTPSAL